MRTEKERERDLVWWIGGFGEIGEWWREKMEAESEVGFYSVLRVVWCVGERVKFVLFVCELGKEMSNRVGRARALAERAAFVFGVLLSGD